MTNLSVKTSIATETQIRKTLDIYSDGGLRGEDMPKGSRHGEILHEIKGVISAPSAKGAETADALPSFSDEIDTGTAVTELGHSLDGDAQEIYEDTVQLDLEDIDLDDGSEASTFSEYIIEYGPDFSWDFETEDARDGAGDIASDSKESLDGELDLNFGDSSSPASHFSPEPEETTHKPASALSGNLAKSADYGTAESGTRPASSARPSVILRYEGTSTTLIPEGALPPFSKRFRLKGLHGSRAQIFEIFQATLRIGAISVPECAAKPAKTREIEMEIDCAGEELDIHVSDSASGYKQSLRFPLPSWDWLNCSIFAPPEVQPGEPFLVQGFVHLPAHEERVLAMARQADEDTQVRGTCCLGSLVGRGSSLTSFLALSNPDVDYEAQQMVWRGEPIAGQFDVFVPKDFSARHVIGTVVSMQDNVPIGQVRFKIKVAPPSQAKKKLQSLWMKQSRFSLASIPIPLRRGRKASSESKTDGKDRERHDE